MVLSVRIGQSDFNYFSVGFTIEPAQSLILYWKPIVTCYAFIWKLESQQIRVLMKIASSEITYFKLTPDEDETNGSFNFNIDLRSFSNIIQFFAHPYKGI